MKYKESKGGYCMDIYEKYSNDEIINTREYIEMLIKEQGIPEVANLLESMRNTIWFSQEQFRDQKDEAEEEQINRGRKNIRHCKK